MDRPNRGGETIYCFGECRFIPDRQLLLHRDVPVRIGSRALDLLHALVRSPGELVSKDELIRAAWPTTFVHEGNLKVNISALRRALPRDPSQMHCIATVPGRGYRFVAPLQIARALNQSALPEAVRFMSGELPAMPVLIGREHTIDDLASALADANMVTVVGPAGVGKTSIAVTVARLVAARIEVGSCFVDLAAIDDPRLVLPAIAFALGVDSNITNILDGLVDRLRDRDVLLVFDNCEHVLSTAASVADHLHQALPNLLILATSREPLRCRSEVVYRLAPLRYPEAGDLVSSTFEGFPAIELLVRRAEEHGYRLEASDMPSLAGISRRLDGIALAIELAAPRLAAHSPAKLLRVLEHSFASLASREKAAPRRHTTLKATLDWSYKLLSRREAQLLRHLSVFGSAFAMDDVRGAFAYLQDAEDLTASLESLAAKSLLSVTYDPGRRYRLLDSTRSFAAELLLSHREQTTAMIAYARYLLKIFEAAEEEWTWRTREDWIALYGPWIHDLRRAIDWTFAAGKDTELGIRLTAAAIPLWDELSSLVECRERVAAALKAADGIPNCDGILKLKLIAAHTQKHAYSATIEQSFDEALKNGIRLADELGSAEHRLRMTAYLAGTQWFTGRHRESLSTLAELSHYAEIVGAHSAVPDIQWHILMNRFCDGEIRHAHTALTEMAREHATVSHRSQISRFMVDRFIAIRTPLALAAWVSGAHRQACDVIEETVRAAESLDHIVSHTVILGLAAIPVSLLNRSLDSAQKYLLDLSDALALRQIDVWVPFIRFYQAVIDAARGDPAGVDAIQAAIDELAGGNLLVHFPMRLAMLTEAALRHSRLDVAKASLAKALDHTQRNGERWYRAELIRLDGLVHKADGDIRNAERLLYDAVEAARQDGALSFELRAATSLVELGPELPRSDAALEELATIWARFDPRVASGDLIAARKLLEECGALEI